MSEMITAKESADYLTAKFGWTVRPQDIGVLARSSSHSIRVDCTRHRHLYAREDIENVVLENENSVSQCRRPFWPRGAERKPSSKLYYYNNARYWS
jgi:hypothetical protein